MVFYLTGASVLILDISIQYLMTGLVCAKKNEVQAKGPVTRPLCLSLSSEAIARVICALSLSLVCLCYRERGSHIAHPINSDLVRFLQFIFT